MHERKSCLKQQKPVNSVRRRHLVTFGELTIYEFPYQAVDRRKQRVSTAPPLTIGWKHDAFLITSIDTFEYERKSNRRSRQDLVISQAQRDAILQDLGYTSKDIQRLARPSRWNKIKSIVSLLRQ
jgi:hypothetical protein